MKRLFKGGAYCLTGFGIQNSGIIFTLIIREQLSCGLPKLWLLSVYSKHILTRTDPDT
ncbi:MAG: hypothetical protein LBK06_08910 [Planctomycetaceae bacterium]|nr:hypothetical protein [Planctomycetaceae bacterium]